MKGLDKSGQAHASGSSDDQKKNCLCSLRFWGEQETSPDSVNGMMKVFSINIYA